MLKVIAVCSGNTCRSPLLGAALELLSDNVSVRTACAPTLKEDDSEPLPCMPKAFKEAADQLVTLGIVGHKRKKRLSKIVSRLKKHRAKVFDGLKPQPTGDEVFIAAADKHKRKLKKWAKMVGHRTPRIEVAGISDFAWKVYRMQLTLKGINPEQAREMDSELADAYRALATASGPRSRA